MKNNLQYALLRNAYILYWSAAAAFLPYMSVYYESKGLTGKQIGLLISIPYLVTMLSSFLLSYLTDLIKKPLLILRMCNLLFMASIFLLSLANGFFAIALSYLVYAIASAPMNPIMDEITLARLKDPTLYGKIRLGGSIGWGGGVLVISYLLSDWNFSTMFLAAGVLLTLFFVNSLFIQDGKAPGEHAKAHISQVWTLIKKKNMALLLIANAVWSLAESSLTGYLFLHIKSLGGDSVMMGLSMSIALVSELLCFLVIEKIIKKYKYSHVVLAAFLVQLVRFTSLTFIKTPMLLLPFQFVGGASFALIWSVTVNYINKTADEEIRTTGQALKTVVSSIGASLTVIIGGFIYDSRGSTFLFSMLAVMLLFAVLSGLWIIRHRQRTRKKALNSGAL